MNVLSVFLSSAAVAVGFSALTVLFVRRPLHVLLCELCGNEARARFWSVYLSVAIVLTALFGMLVSFPLGDDQRWADQPGTALVLAGFRTSLLFLLIVLAALAIVLLTAIGRFERDRRSQAVTPRA